MYLPDILARKRKPDSHLASNCVLRLTQATRSKYLINNIPRGTTRVQLFNFLVSPPHWVGRVGGPSELQPQVQFSCTIADSRLDDELSVAVLEFTDTPNWLQLVDLDPYGFPKKTDMGTLWRWVNLAERDESGQTAFIRAAIEDNLLYTETLAEFEDTGVDAQDGRGRAALHWACAKSLPDMVGLCLSISGCNVALRDQDNLTAFDIAKQGNNELIADLFYASMMEMDPRDPQAALLRALTVTSRPSKDLPLFPGVAIFQPIEDRNPEMVAALIACGVDLTTTNGDGYTALHVAAALTDNAGIVRRLLEAGSGIDDTGAGDMTPLHCAARSSDQETVKVLLEWKPDLLLKDSGEKTALHVAAQNGQQDIARLLRNYCADTITVDGRTTRDLLAMGMAAPPTEVPDAGPQKKDQAVPPPPDWVVEWENVGLSSLHDAVRDCNVMALVSLIEAGADVNHFDTRGRTPLQMAAADGHADIVTVLLSKGANIDAAMGRTWRALHYATSEGHIEVVRILLANGANIEAVVSVGQTALHLAAAGGHAEIAHALLLKEAIIEALDDIGCVALHYATIGGHTKVGTVLLTHGANIEARDKDGRTVLHHAASSGDPEVVTFLLASGANIEARGPNGTTLQMALAYDNTVVGEILVAHGAETTKLGRLRHTLRQRLRRRQVDLEAGRESYAD